MKVPKIFYPGSLFVNNFKEAKEIKGITVVDFDKNQVEFLPVNHITSFITIDAPEYETFNESWIHSLPLNNTTRLRLRVKQSIQSPNRSYINLLTSLIREHKQPLSINVVPIYAEQSTDEVFVEKLNEQLDDIENPLVIDEIIKSYAEEMKIESHIDTLIQTNHDIFKKVTTSNIDKCSFTINKFLFSNTFSYGDTNGIEFNKKGIIGIFGKNKHGKSGFLNSLFYAIFGDTFKAFSNESIVNSNRDNCETYVEITDSNNNFYTIKRTLAKKGKRTVDFKINDVSKNEEKVNQTDETISKYLGTFDQYQLSNFSFQGKITNIMDKKNADRKSAFLQFFDLNIFNQLYKISNDELKESRARLKNYKIVDVDSQILEYKEFIRRCNVEILETAQKQAESEVILNQYKKELVDYTTQLVKIDPNIKPEVYYTSQIATQNANKTSNDSKIIISTNTIVQNQQQIEFYKDQLVAIDKTIHDLEISATALKYSQDNINLLAGVQADLKLISDAIRVSENEKSSIEPVIKNLEKNIEVLNLQPWMRNTDLCKTCTLAINAFKSDSDLVSIKQKLNGIIESIQKNITIKTDYESVISDIEKEQQVKTRIDSLNKDIEANKLKLESFKEKISNFETSIITQTEAINTYIAQNLLIDQLIDSHNKEIANLSVIEEQRKNNYIIKTKISEVESKIKNVEVEIRNCITVLATNSTKIADYEVRIKDLKDTLLLIVELETKIKIYDIYVNLMHKDGLPLKILTKLLKLVEQKTNFLLAQCSDLLIEFDIVDEDFNIYYYDGKDSERKDILVMSGQEGVFIGLCLRSALAQINTKHKADFMVIDEGMGALDDENIISVRNLFDVMKTEFNFILLITHLDVIKDYVDHKIDVVRDDKFSKLTI